MTARNADPAAGLDRGEDHDALAKNPAVGGIPVRDSRKSVIRIAERRLRRPSPANVSRLRRDPGPLLERRDHRERAEIHERVGRAVEEQALEAGCCPPANAASPTSM